ncbi:hypothetical protein V8E36_007584 [Tilletia maclaganii]
MPFRMTATADSPDQVSQYLKQRRSLRKKSSAQLTSTSSDNSSIFPAHVELNDGRIYLPGQVITATIHFPLHLSPEQLQSRFEDITVEFKGWTHSYGWMSTSNSTYPVFQKDIHFSTTAPLFFPTAPASEIQIQRSASGNTYTITTRLPTTVSIKRKWNAASAFPSTQIPPTFRDLSSNSLNNSVYWAFKLSASPQGSNLKRNIRIWKPFLLVPFASAPFIPLQLPDLSRGPKRPGSTLPTPLSIQAQCENSGGWELHRFQSKLKSAFVFSKAVITVHLWTPAHVTSGPAPFMLHVAVSAKKEADLLPPSGSIRLPDLPLLAGHNGDAVGGEKGKGKSTLSSSSEGDDAKPPSFEIMRKLTSRAQGCSNINRHRIPVHTEWNHPSSPSQGYTWTNAIPTHEAGLFLPHPSHTTKPKDDESISDLSSAFEHTRAALLTGTLHASCPPCIEMNALRVRYRLSLNWAQPGWGNTLSVKVRNWAFTSGIGAEEVSGLGERGSGEEEEKWRELERRALGNQAALLVPQSQDEDQEGEWDVKKKGGGKYDSEEDDDFDADSDDDGGKKSRGLFARFRRSSSHKASSSAAANGKSGKADEAFGEEDEEDDDDGNDSDDSETSLPAYRISHLTLNPSQGGKQ